MSVVAISREVENPLLDYAIGVWRTTCIPPETEDAAETKVRLLFSESARDNLAGRPWQDFLMAEIAFNQVVSQKAAERRIRKLEYDFQERIAALETKTMRRALALPTRKQDATNSAAADDDQPVTLPICLPWVDRVHFAGELVTHAGALHQAIRDTGKPPYHEDWTCIAAAGRSFSVKRTYDPNETYRELDVVALGAASFAARVDNPGPCPGDGWQLIAGQGRRGAPGERGPRGPAGPKCEHMTVDDQGMLTLINADGTSVQCDLYPVLIKLK
jgi:hypothetical protein